MPIPTPRGAGCKRRQAGRNLRFSPSAGEVTKQCEVQDFDLTAHANREDLLDFVGQVDPRAVLLGHGDDASRNWFEAQIHARYPKVKVIQPKPGETVEA